MICIHKKRKKIEEKNVPFFFWIRWDSCPQSPGDRQCRLKHHQISAFFTTIKYAQWAVTIKLVHWHVHIKSHTLYLQKIVRTDVLFHNYNENCSHLLAVLRTCSYSESKPTIYSINSMIFRKNLMKNQLFRLNLSIFLWKIIHKNVTTPFPT